MKFALFLFLLLCCPMFAEDLATSTVVDGVKEIRESLRDPDSLKLGKVFTIHNKFGDAVCYDYYARNGFGGMNIAHAVYVQDAKNGKIVYVLHATEDADWNVSPEFYFRCGPKAMKNAEIKDVTKEAMGALNHAE